MIIPATLLAVPIFAAMLIIQPDALYHACCKDADRIEGQLSLFVIKESFKDS
jgi:hypothetical protein